MVMVRVVILDCITDVTTRLCYGLYYVAVLRLIVRGCVERHDSPVSKGNGVIRPKESHEKPKLENEDVLVFTIEDGW